MNIRPTIIGAIIGDMVGSFYSWKDASKIDFRNLSSQILATQDSLIVAEIAEVSRSFTTIEDENRETNIAIQMPYIRGNESEWKHCLYSTGYTTWCQKLETDEYKEKYKYTGDPAILIRTIPASFYYKSIDQVLQKAELLSSSTSSDISEIQSSKTIALAIHLAYSGFDKEGITHEIYKQLGDGLLSSFGLPYNPVEMAIKAFMDSTDFESAIRNAISLSQDKFNLATITGALAAAYYNAVPEDVAYLVRTKMPYWLQRTEIDFFRKLRKCDLIKVTEPPTQCPLCGSPVVGISYGYISDVQATYKSYWRSEPEPILEKDRDNERLSIIGGCVHNGNDPKWGCVGCEVKFNDVDPYIIEYMRKKLTELNK